MAEQKIKYHSFSASDVGRKRTNNEDNFGEITVELGKAFIVCDGMGGHAAGEKASEIAVQTIQDFFKTNEYDNIPSLLTEAIQHANSNIWEEAQNDPSLKGMGTTCVVVFVHNNGEVYIGHVGDSRCYLLNDDQNLTVLTRDHSYVQFLIETGEIQPEEAFNHPSKNRILKALGIDEHITPEVTSEPHKLPVNSTLVLCTDGLNDMLTDNEIKQLLITNSGCEEQTKQLIEAALEKGGKDNVTITIIQFLETPFEQAMLIEKEGAKAGSFKKVFFSVSIFIVLLGLLVFLFWPIDLKGTLKEENVEDEKEIVIEAVPAEAEVDVLEVPQLPKQDTPVNSEIIETQPVADERLERLDTIEVPSNRVVKDSVQSNSEIQRTEDAPPEVNDTVIDQQKF
ncbi:MAG: Stp1/IreP family PP2C-type Ser/Thr phosphatase [Crocinitomicaceae bacterium]|nr:Stp1/IreP family PP2C-type Ser/Thr phosphatase [Crocinitomicaceae bacterium]